jgi:phenylpropionate dioxygenase-like ring-hydroxylating dioxygenase large terminal subunit
MTELLSSARDVDTSEVPFAITNRRLIPAQRYYDKAFFELEKRKLWPHVWQNACRLEEIPNVGDFVEYWVADQSVIVVRTSATEIKAFQNACRHRATQLAVGCGTFRGGQIVCPFHGWRWNLDGSSSFVFGRDSFPPECVTDADLHLVECQVDTWANCVFINMDPDAPPLQQQLAPMPSLLDPLNVGLMRVYWWKAVKLKANWKLAMEAFMEGFHVPQTHPQLTFGDDAGFVADEHSNDGICYFSHENGHAHFQASVPSDDPSEDGQADEPPVFMADAAATMSDRQIANLTVEANRLLYEGLDAMVLAKDMHVLNGLRNTDYEPGQFGARMTEALYEWNLGAGIPFPDPDPVALARWGGVFFMFPNFFILPDFGNALMYRFRPDSDDPESCYFELWSNTLYPEGQEPGKPTFGGVHPKDDATEWPLIPRQDFSNIERQQRGLHTQGMHGMRTSEQFEDAIPNMHVHLDAYLAQ